MSYKTYQIVCVRAKIKLQLSLLIHLRFWSYHTIMDDSNLVFQTKVKDEYEKNIVEYPTFINMQ